MDVATSWKKKTAAESDTGVLIGLKFKDFVKVDLADPLHWDHYALPQEAVNGLDVVGQKALRALARAFLERSRDVEAGPCEFTDAV